MIEKLPTYYKLNNHLILLQIFFTENLNYDQFGATMGKCNDKQYLIQLNQVNNKQTAALLQWSVEICKMVSSGCLGTIMEYIFLHIFVIFPLITDQRTDQPTNQPNNITNQVTTLNKPKRKQTIILTGHSKFKYLVSNDIPSLICPLSKQKKKKSKKETYCQETFKT